MTKPNDEATKLARECAEMIKDRVLEVLHDYTEKLLAAKDAEIERLRESAESIPRDFCLCEKCRCTWNWTITKSSRCPACGSVEGYKPDGMGE